MLISTLRERTENPIVVVGNLTKKDAANIKSYGVRYIDEDDIDYGGRLPKVEWTEKYRHFGWYKQMFIRLCIDRFMDTDQVVIMDSEVFVFDNWRESKFYDKRTGYPRYFYWIPQKRKPEWDYKMYSGAAYLLSFLPECRDIMDYAQSDNYKRHISGVVLFSTKNVAQLWRRLEKDTDLNKNMNELFNKRMDLAFSDHDIYGLAVEYGLFDDMIPTKIYNNLLGWYDNHKDKDFVRFKKDAMWSMCQNYSEYTNPEEYLQYMKTKANEMKRQLPIAKYWNKADYPLIDNTFDKVKGMTYFKRYKKQLNHTQRKRYETMYGALNFIKGKKVSTIVEIGTLRDNTKGGGHSTYKFAEYCARFGGVLHTVDVLPEAIDFSKKATASFQPWIEYHCEDSSIFLKNNNKKIDLLYLDGFDSTPGMENAASKKQLEEITAALPHLSGRCAVLLDDADLPERGKTLFSSAFLLSQGFKLAIDGYQQLYTREFEKKGPLNLLKKYLRGTV